LKENHNIIATYDPSIAVKAYFCVTSVHARTANACSAYVAAIITISLSKWLSDNLDSRSHDCLLPRLKVQYAMANPLMMLRT
jgi:hypothetical protein